jgi:hypothetical protein
MLDRVWLLRPEVLFNFCVGDNPDDAVRLAGLVGVEPARGQLHGFLWNGDSSSGCGRRCFWGREPASPRREVNSGTRSG